MEDRTPRSSHDHGSDNTIKTRTRVFSGVDDLIDHVFRESSPSTSDSRFDVSRPLTVVTSPLASPSTLDSRFDVSRPLTVVHSPLAGPVREMSEEKTVKSGLKVFKTRARAGALGTARQRLGSLLTRRSKCSRLSESHSPRFEVSPLQSPHPTPQRNSQEEMIEEKKIKPLKAKYWDNEAFERRREKDKRKATEERLASEAQALASHPETRRREVFPFLREPEVKRPEGPTEKPQEPTLNAMAEEPHCLIASRDYHASYRKATAKKDPSSLKQSVIQRPTLKMVVEEPHCAKAKVIPPSSRNFQEEMIEEKIVKPLKTKYCGQEIVAFNSGHEESDEERLLGKRSPPTVATNRKRMAKRSSLVEDELPDAGRVLYDNNLSLRENNDLLDQQDYGSPQRNSQEEMIKRKSVKPLKAKYLDQGIVAFNSDHEESYEEAEKPVVVEKPHWPTLDELVARAKASQEEAEKPQVEEIPHSPTFEELVNRRKAKLESLLLSQQLTKVSKVPVEDIDVVERLEDERDFVRRVRAGERFLLDPLKVTSEQLQDFYDKKGQYLPKKHVPFAEDVLVGMPENVISAQSRLPKLGLPDDFDFGGRPLELKMCLDEPHSFWYGESSTRLGRLGGKEVSSKEPTVVSEDGIFFREFQTHGRLTPLIDQNIFMKRRMDQDLTAVLNDHYKDTPEDVIPKMLPWSDASAILDQQLPQFSNQIESRNNLDREAAVQSFVPVSRLETNVIESERQRWKNQAEAMISKRAPDLDDERRRQMDRKRQNKIDSRARQKAEKEAARLKSRF